MHALPSSLRSSLPFRLSLLAVLAGVVLGGGACSEERPPGARELTDAEMARGSQPEPPAGRGSSPESGGAPGPAPAGSEGPVFGPGSPRVIASDPPNGATGVDPSRATLSVTFDQEMDREGWAWVIEDEATAPEIGEARFGPSGRTNTVEVDLEPGRRYVIWVNSERFPYFRSVDGTPAEPFRWTFSTAGAPAGEAGGGGVGMVSSREPVAAGGAPRVVELDPPNGATGVDPDRATIRVTFDRPMDGSWAWVTEGGTTPPPTAGEPSFDPAMRTNTLPVALAPNTTYTIWINGERYLHFRSVDGIPVEPVRWTFTTGEG